MRPIEIKTSEAGKFFETFLLHEIRAYQSYNATFDSLFYWRTSTDLEVDLIIGRTPLLAAEFKCTETIRSKDLNGLRAFSEEHPVRHKIVVYCGKEARTTEDGIQLLPWQKFCKMLWHHEFHLKDRTPKASIEK
jgi:predicted AAA+ superfamily ATPase